MLIHRFLRLGAARRALVVEAALCLMAARLTLLFVPFARLAQRWGEFVPPGDPRAAQAREPRSGEAARRAIEVGWAVRGAARHVPFGAVCLPQAMAAHAMLQRRGVASVVHFGAAKGKARPLDAHAWLDAAGVEVTGYPVAEGFTEIGCFV